MVAVVMSAPTDPEDKINFAELIRTVDKSTTGMLEVTRRQRECNEQWRQEQGLPARELDIPVSELELLLQKVVWPAPQQRVQTLELESPAPVSEWPAAEPAPDPEVLTPELALPVQEPEVPELQQVLLLLEEEEVIITTLRQGHGLIISCRLSSPHSSAIEQISTPLNKSTRLEDLHGSEYMTNKCTYFEDTRCARCPEGSYNPAKNKKQNCERCRICEGEISVIVKRSTPAKEPAGKPATPAKEPAVKPATPAKEPAVKPATPAKEPAGKPATPTKEPAGRIFLISCLIPAFVLLTVIICVYLLHRTWQPKKEKMSTGTSQDESLFNDESETISECRRSEEEEGPVPVQEESCKETFRCV
ncbi:hypothetical protein EOD39_9629 [Acipenser ruthenus]|uniref:Uncharacterized protein n=1 Tax=Acipenser ruthenus TaxID=7906 RepID=A0A662YWZ4_ACIRT|nr:hypothetical protein EOD39_9629 [Acipenser ruthenus]